MVHAQYSATIRRRNIASAHVHRLMKRDVNSRVRVGHESGGAAKAVRQERALNAQCSCRRRHDPQTLDRRSRQIPRPSAAARRRKPAQPVRRRRFRRIHRATSSSSPSGSMPWCTVFSSMACCAAQPRCVPSARARARGGGRIHDREAVAEPRRRLGACSSARCSRRATAASSSLHMTCLAHNRRMQQLARKFDAELTFDFGSVVGEVEAPFPTPMSMLREFVADGHGFATAVLDAQSRLLAAGSRPDLIAQARRRLPPHRVRRRSRCARKTAQSVTPGTAASDTAGAPPGSRRPAGSMYRAIAPG